jgi:hypothetical protein
MITTNIVIPSWVEVLDKDFYNALNRNITFFNNNNTIISIPPIPPATEPEDPAVVWLALFNTLVAELQQWRVTDRGWRPMIYALTTMGFDLSAFSEADLINYNGRVAYGDISKIDSEVTDLMEQSKFTNIFNFQGLVNESKSWPDSYILNNNDSSVLASIVSRIDGSAAYENSLIDTLTENMTELLQTRALNRMLENDPSREVYFDYIQSLPLYLINTRGYKFPDKKP